MPRSKILITLICRKLPQNLKTKVAQLDNTHSTINSVMDIIKTHLKTAKRIELREETESESDEEEERDGDGDRDDYGDD